MLVTNPEVAYSVLFQEAHELWSKTADESTLSAKNRHFTTKDKLLELFEEKGIILLTQKRNEKELTASFKQLSSVGVDWRRDIGGKKVALKTIDELIQKSKDSAKNTFVLTGEPGAGKTCVLLELKEQMEQKIDDSSVIFIQSRAFENCENSDDLESIGLPADLIEKVAQMANYKKVILLVDSLDVLSIAKNHKIFDIFLSLIDRIKNINNVVSIIACREFDYHYDSKLADKNWDKIHISPLDWEDDIQPLLQELKLPTEIDETTQKILSNPLYLSLYVEMATQDNGNIKSPQFLIHEYINHYFKNIDSHQKLEKSAQVIAEKMLQERRLSLSRYRVKSIVSNEDLTSLLSHGLLRESENKKEITFRHQIFLDAFNIRQSLHDNVNLKQFINSLIPTPFIRPTVREYTLFLASYERGQLCKHLRAVISDDGIAYHLKRLVIEVFASLEPIDEDWGFINFLRNNHQNLFNILYFSNKQECWFLFWQEHLVPLILDTNKQNEILRHSQYLHEWHTTYPRECLDFWSKALVKITNPELRKDFASSLYLPLSEFNSTPLCSASYLVKQLITENIDPYYLGEIICQLIRSENAHDELLYQFIFQDVDSNMKCNKSFLSK